MLSEIFILKLEAAKRGAAEESRIPNARFVPLAPSIVPQKTIEAASRTGTAPRQHS